MGIYATTTSLQVLMVGTKFDTATSNLCDKLITHAENEVDKYLSKRYDIEALHALTPVPPIVESIAETLAEGYMYQRMSRGGKDAMARASALIKQALDNLQMVADYKLDVIDSNGNNLTEGTNTAYNVQTSTPDYVQTFNEDDPLRWEIDRTKLDDIEDERGK